MTFVEDVARDAATSLDSVDTGASIPFNAMDLAIANAQPEAVSLLIEWGCFGTTEATSCEGLFRSAASRSGSSSAAMAVSIPATRSVLLLTSATSDPVPQEHGSLPGLLSVWSEAMMVSCQAWWRMPNLG